MNFDGIRFLVYLASSTPGSVLVDIWDFGPHVLVCAAHFCRTSGSARTSQFRDAATFLKCKKTQHTILTFQRKVTLLRIYHSLHSHTGRVYVLRREVHPNK